MPLYCPKTTGTARYTGSPLRLIIEPLLLTMRIASSFTGCGTSSAMSGVCSPTMTCPSTSKLTRTTTLPVTIDPFPCSCTVLKYSWGLISDFCKSACCLALVAPKQDQIGRINH